MNEVIRISELRRPVRRSAFDQKASVALIMEQVQRLAAHADAVDYPLSTSPQFVRGVIATRARRREFFGPDLFADPAWDILLELYVLHCEQRRASISKLSIDAGIPATTALRWMEKLHKDGLIDRENDPFDGRRVWVELSAKGVEAMESFLRRIGPETAPL